MNDDPMDVPTPVWHTQKIDGGPAYPTPLAQTSETRDVSEVVEAYIHHPGMSLRDWFAGMALMGIAANDPPSYSDVGISDTAELSYQIADAMLAERAKQKVADS